MPERLFADPAKPADDPSQPQGVSAVKALAIAAAQGQKIYTLNDKNQAYHASIVASLGTDADTKQEISNALAAGKEVTVHQADISANGWTGMGYIILDPDSGAGAYKISGGANGGFFVALFLAVWVALLGLLIGHAGAGLLAATLAIAPFIALSWAFKNLILKLDPGAQFLISYVEFALVAIAAIIAPEIFFADFFIELLLYIQSVWQL